MNKLNLPKTGYVVGAISTIFFIVCALWGLVLTSSELKDLHFKLLQIGYPGFSLTFVGFVVGLVEAFIYGWIIGVLFAWLCKKICTSGGVN